MLPIIACLVWFWFDGSGDLRRRRAVLDGLLGGLAALMVSRLVQVPSLHRPRPGLSREFDFVQPIGGYVNDWSSFPSDTAALACALVAAIWTVSRPLGLAGLAWAVVVVSFRSEEHTSELQSLMRISYAVFCLKKKTKNTR